MSARPLRHGFPVVLMAVISVGAGNVPTLVDAVKAGNRDAVRALLKQSPGRTVVNAPEVDGTTSLHWAVRADDQEMVQLLLQAGANAKAANRYGVIPLTLAAVNGSAAMIETLVKAGADVNAALPEGETVLMTAARTGNLDALQALIAHGASVQAKEQRFGETALIWAVAQNHAPAIKTLVEAGAEVNGRSAPTSYPKLVGPLQRLTPGQCAGGQGLQVNCLPTGQWTPLMYAARQGAVEATRALMGVGADPDLTDPDGTTALVLAILNAHYDVASLLLEKGANPSIADKWGMTALYATVNMNTLPFTIGRPGPKPTGDLNAVGMAKALLAHGADPNTQLKMPMRQRHHSGADGSLGAGTTPLMRAAKSGDVAMVRLLIENGADAKLTQKNSTTALMIAAGFGSRPRADDDEEATDRGTQADAVEVIKVMVEHGVDLHAVNDNGETALFLATGEAIIRFLVASGLKLDDYNYAGQTPLDAWLGNVDRDGKLQRPGTVAVLRQLMNVGTATDAAPPQ
jgi:ankyrin repeat protein